MTKGLLKGKTKMKGKTKSYASALRALLATAACAGLGLVPARATVLDSQQLPGHGTVTGQGLSSIPNIANGTETIALHSGDTAITWASTGGTINTSQPGGFNIGQSAALHFTSSGTAALLNVDTSGSVSQIYGTLTSGTGVSIFVANANGITLGPNATITAPAGLGLIAASVNSARFLTTGNVPISFATSGPLTVQGNLQGVGAFVLLAGSGAVNISPTQNGLGAYFGTFNVAILGGVGATFEPNSLTTAVGPNSSTPSASSATTVTLNLGNSGYPYPFSYEPRTSVDNGYPVAYVYGNIVNNGVLNTSNTSQPLIANLQWTGTLTNNGTINGELDSYSSAGRVAFNGNTSAQLAYGGLVNNGTIATDSIGTLNVILPGTIINNAGATISNVGGEVYVAAGTAGALPLFTGVGGAVINHGSVIAFDGVVLVASNPNHVGPHPGGEVYSDGTIEIQSGIAHTNSGLMVGSFTGNTFLGGTVATPNDAAGLASVYFQSGATPASLFTLRTNVTASSVTFSGGSLTGPATLTTGTLFLPDLTGNVNNVTSPTNYLANGFHVASGSFGNTNVTISLATTSEGAVGPQKVNLNVTGNAAINSGFTSTFVKGTGSVATSPEANVGSHMLVQASGNLTVNGSTPTNYAFSTGALKTSGFVFPGGIALIAGHTLTLNTVVDNGYAPTVLAGQGIFLQAPTIRVPSGSSVITNGNAWVNFSTQPSMVPPIYGVAAVPGSTTNFRIVNDPSAFHIRPYPN